jgi:uncharacterized protein (TIGR02145 family)
VEDLPGKVAGVADLPDCDDNYEGDEVFVEELSKALQCVDGLWKESPKDLFKKTSSSSKKQGKDSSSSTSSSSTSSSSASSSSKGSSHGRSCDKCYTDGGILKDERDGTKYKTVVINGRRWMAENLRYVPENLRDSVSCYMDSAKLCDKYGPMYPYSAKGVSWYLDVEDVFDSHPFPFKGSVCPEGWSVPNTDDWNSLFAYVKEIETGGDSTVWLRDYQSLWDASWLYKDSRSEYRGNNALGFSILGENFQDTTVAYPYAWPVFWVDLSGPSNFRDAKGITFDMTLTIGGWFEQYNSGDDKKRAFIRCIENVPEEAPEIAFDSIVDKRYGDKYKIVKIGSQWWMAENLRFKENAELCHPYSDNKYIKDECHYPVGIPEGYSKDICPEGWLVPTMGDWYNLLYYVATHNGDEPIWASLIDTAYWESLPDSLKHSDYNFGMNIRAAGEYSRYPYRGEGGSVFSGGNRAAFLTRTVLCEMQGFSCYDYVPVPYIYIDEPSPSLYFSRYGENGFDELGYSVRCIKEGTGEE